MSSIDDDRQLYKVLDTGALASRFFTTDLGRAVLDRAATDFDNAVIDMLQCDPTDTKRVMYLQQQANAPRLAVEYLNNLIEDGNLSSLELTNTRT